MPVRDTDIALNFDRRMQIILNKMKNGIIGFNSKSHRCSSIDYYEAMFYLHVAIIIESDVRPIFFRMCCLFEVLINVQPERTKKTRPKNGMNK